jgi:hypothetical protein
MKMKLTMTAMLVFVTGGHAGGEEIYSGPQVGEKLPSFEFRRVFGDDAGKNFDPLKAAADKPIAIVFIHDFTRPSVGLTRAVMNYAGKRKPDGLTSCLILLGDDITDMEARLRRAKHALPGGVEIGVSVDGQEGPGAYGLNRKVTLTVLIGNAGRVTANFAIVQPDMKDALRITKAMVDVLGGGEPPSLAQLVPNQGRRVGMDEVPPRFRELLAPVINKSATPEQVTKAAEAVERYAAGNPAFKKHLETVARRIIDAGRLENYGTPQAREYLRKWSAARSSESQGEVRSGDKQDSTDCARQDNEQ